MNLKINKIDFTVYKQLKQNINNDLINLFKDCIEKELSLKIVDISLYKSQNNWPFDEVFYINNKYIAFFYGWCLFHIF